MASVMEFMQLCRLCLVKDQVNIPIFEEQGDIRQIFLKISACLPVKLSREDNLPKKICDGCSYKLELLYQFWNTSANSEKQLLKWLSQVGIEKTPTSDKVAAASVKVQPHSINSDNVVLKQEVVDLGDSHGADDLDADDLNVSNDAQDYILQQQQLPYQPVTFEFQQEGFTEGEATSSTAGPSATITSEAAEVAPKRKRRAAAMKALPPHIDSEEEDDVDMVETKIAKTEEESDDDSASEDPEPTTFVGLPSTSTDNEQPGPSGVGKGTTEAPFDPLTDTMSEAGVHQTIYECEVCTQIFSTKKEFLTHHMNQFGETFNCCRCDEQFKTTTELYQHYELHKGGNVVIENDESSSTGFDYSENVEAVMNIPNEPINDTEELLYILDGSQCINEVVIEQESDAQETETETSAIKPENYTIVQVEHGYMLPSVFKGQLESKRRYKKKDDSLIGFGEEEVEEIETVVEQPESTSSRSPYMSMPKSRPKRRHEVPDFSATNYVVLNPNEEVDTLHYKCLRCEQLFISKFAFFRHIEKGKCYINSCDVCSASFTRNSEFYDHYLAEHTDRAICNFCFRTFMYEKNVKEHMLRHLDQFRHRCEQCNKGFYTVREYRNHYKNRHMGIRHKCDVCGRSFADEYYFKRHVATHEKASAAKVGFSVAI